MNSSCKLPLNFDPKPLQIDLQKIQPAEWNRHFNADYYEGDWGGIALRSVGGAVTQIYPDPHAHGEIMDTEVLERCPNIAAVVRQFQCDIHSARLLRLAAGSRIKEHRDYKLAFDDGEVRLHVPIATNEKVDFFLNGRRVEMKEGECWYLNFTLPHKVNNNGPTDRVHLVLDCVLNDWLRSLLAAGTPSEMSATNALPITSSLGGWNEFREFVLQRRDVQERLRETDDRQAFIELVIAEGAANGYVFRGEEVRQAILQARRNWVERWID